MQVEIHSSLTLSLEYIKNWKFKQKIAHLEQRLQILSKKVDWETNTTIPEQEEINQTKQELVFYYDCEMSYWSQRARISWHLDYEKNTEYFHSIATKRKSKNLIKSLKNEQGEWTIEFSELTSLAFKHFTGILQSEDNLSKRIQAQLENLQMPILTPTKASEIINPIQPSEIKEAVFSLPKDSAPGSDGYHASFFFQKNWSLVSANVIAMVRSIWNYGRILKEMNKTNVVLIPKKPHPSTFQDLRPIILSNVSYKILFKVLCNRLKAVLPDLIHPCQSAFLKGRLISNNVMLAAELMHQIHTSRGKRKKLAALKIDFSKAFDRISWNFIIALLKRMQFPPAFVNLIYQCLSTVEYHFMLNDKEIFALELKCGIRQRDPLSPYLYILAANVLSCLISKAVATNQWEGIQISRNSSPITHLFYADGSLLFMEATYCQFQHVKNILEKFNTWSGQKINKSKSTLIFRPNTSHTLRVQLSNSLSVNFSRKLGKNLGTYIDPGRNKQVVYDQILSAIQTRAAN